MRDQANSPIPSDGKAAVIDPADWNDLFADIEGAINDLASRDIPADKMARIDKMLEEWEARRQLLENLQ